MKFGARWEIRWGVGGEELGELLDITKINFMNVLKLKNAYIEVSTHVLLGTVFLIGKEY